jgi:hypothetical protein
MAAMVGLVVVLHFGQVQPATVEFHVLAAVDLVHKNLENYSQSAGHARELLVPM